MSADSALLEPRASIAEPIPPPPRRLAIGASAALVGQLSTVAGGIVTSIFLAQTFGPAGTGTYALIGNLFAAVLLLAALGLPTGITFLVSRGAWPPRRALKQSLAAALPMGLAGTTLGLAFYAWTNNSVLEGISGGEALAVMAAVPFGLAWLFCSAIAIGCDLYERIATFQLSRAALTVVAVIGPGIAFGLSGAIVGFAAAQVLSAAAVGISLARFNRRESQEPASGVNRRETTRPLRAAFRFGRRAWSADALQFLNYRLDLFILAAYVARADVGQYSLAVSLTMLAWLLPSAIGQVLLPRTASLDSASIGGDVSRARADGAVARVIRHTVILQLPTGAAVVVLLVVGIPLVYGPPFHDSIVLGLLLLPGVLAASIAKVVSPVITGRGYPIYSVYNVLITVPVTVALYLLLIPPLGATGAALASTASYMLTTVLAMYFYRRVTDGSVRAALGADPRRPARIPRGRHPPLVLGPSSAAPLRVLLTPEWYPWPEQPLYGVFCREQARAVARREDVAVLTWRLDPTLRVPFCVDVAHEDGLRTLRVRFARGRIPRSTFVFKLTGSLVALARLSRGGWWPDVIHAHEYVAGPVALTLGALTRAPVVVSEHYSGFALGTLPARERRRARWAFERARVVCPVSRDLAEHIRALAPAAKLNPVPNVVDTDVFVPGPTASPGDTPRLVTIGSLVEIKGHRYLVKAVGNLRRAGRDVSLDVIGDGPLRSEARSAGPHQRCRRSHLLPRDQEQARGGRSPRSCRRIRAPEPVGEHALRHARGDGDWPAGRSQSRGGRARDRRARSGDSHCSGLP